MKFEGYSKSPQASRIEAVVVQDTVLNFPGNTTITMTCATYNGEADHTKLTAIRVDAIN